MTNRHGICPIWGVDCALSQPYADLDPGLWRVENSHRAGGAYEITTDARLAIEEGLQDTEKARLTSILVEQWMKGVPFPRLTADDVQRARESRRLPAHERADRLLRLLAMRSSHIGEFLSIIEEGDDGHNYQASLGWSESTNVLELSSLSEYLENRGWIANHDYTGTLFVATVEVPGYIRIEALETNPDSSQCFVAMWFDKSMNDAYEDGFKPAIEATGYSPVRIDRKEFNGKIDDEIIAQIRRSRFLVADFTHGEDGARGGVYYEAGFAQGLDLQVIFTCRKDMIDKAHFDTRQFNHIVWEDYDDLREQLKNRIGSVLGDGPNAKR